MDSVSGLVESAERKVGDAVGGWTRVKLIVILAFILGLPLADMGTLSAMTAELKTTFHIDDTQVGLLLSVVSFIGAVATIPMGVPVDRISRRKLLLWIVPLWVVAEGISGTATSYLYLLLTRLGLGAVVAVAWPAVASLTGDFFPALDRSRIYGWIVAGELVGIGVGYFVGGELASLIDWRWGFYAMTVPGIVLEFVIWKWLPEPNRGGQPWIDLVEHKPAAPAGKQPDRAGSGEMSDMQAKVLGARVAPREHLVLHQDPTDRSVWWAVAYLLRLPTYSLAIAASALAYYFFGGLRTFAMLYFPQHYGISTSTVAALVFVVGIGALVGVVLGGYGAQWLLERGRLDARLLVPSVVLFVSVPLFGFAVWTHSVWIGMTLLTFGAAAFAAAIAPLDAARLDIVHPRIWGRGEAGRMALRSLLEGGAPLLFGAVSGWLGGGTAGLEWTFLLMLIPLLVAGGLAWPARRTYVRDVATAAASVKETAQPE